LAGIFSCQADYRAFHYRSEWGVEGKVSPFPMTRRR
jgi:hypothetical protein